MLCDVACEAGFLTHGFLLTTFKFVWLRFIINLTYETYEHWYYYTISSGIVIYIFFIFLNTSMLLFLFCFTFNLTLQQSTG